MQSTLWETLIFKTDRRSISSPLYSSSQETDSLLLELGGWFGRLLQQSGVFTAGQQWYDSASTEYSLSTSSSLSHVLTSSPSLFAQICNPTKVYKEPCTTHQIPIWRLGGFWLSLQTLQNREKPPHSLYLEFLEQRTHDQNKWSLFTVSFKAVN